MDAVGLVFSLLSSFLLLIPLIKILRKAGYSGWWGLMMFVPLLNIIMLYVFAYADWPTLRNDRNDHFGIPHAGADYLGERK